MSIKRFLKNFMNDEHGQSTTEYILILAVVVMIAMKFRKIFGDKLGGLINNVGESLDGAASDAAKY